MACKISFKKQGIPCTCKSNHTWCDIWLCTQHALLHHSLHLIGHWRHGISLVGDYNDILHFVTNKIPDTRHWEFYLGSNAPAF